VVLLSAIAAFDGQEPADRFEKVVTRMVQAINAKNYPGVQEDFSKVMLDAFPLEKSKVFFKDLSIRYGKIEKLDPPRLMPPAQAVFAAHFERVVLDIKFVLDDQDKIIGLWFLPHTPPLPVPEKHVTKLRLPFDGEWLVFWGGDTRELNRHHDVPNQKFAFDFLIADSSGKTYTGEGNKNEDYFAFGQEIRSPADGIATDVITGVRDNVPGSMNPYSTLGNAVLIKHREHEVSVLAHFKQGSIRIEPGDKVKKGQVLGLCGNSGNSSEPHLHYHLQNTPIIQDGTGIKCFFENIIVTGNRKGKSLDRYSPVQGDIIRGKTE
jgi:murein DD-endopeptidase MepM/ murein hydrolase activator NlpD|tara:strand:- start:291 stop:1253 length:963 start_codon:yes stop_codon:yes gene_type:complete